jgi:hypothetical protein
MKQPLPPPPLPLVVGGVSVFDCETVIMTVSVSVNSPSVTLNSIEYVPASPSCGVQLKAPVAVLKVVPVIEGVAV